MEAGIQDVRKWMIINDKLKINDEKSDFILLGSKAQLKKVDIDKITVIDSLISTSKSAIRNLGTWFDCNLMMSTHVTKTCKAGYFYLHNNKQDKDVLNSGDNGEVNTCVHHEPPRL